MTERGSSWTDWPHIEMTLPEEAARQVISDHLDGTATLMRIGRQAAKFYVTDDVIRKIADQLLGIDTCQGRAQCRVTGGTTPAQAPLTSRIRREAPPSGGIPECACRALRGPFRG